MRRQKHIILTKRDREADVFDEENVNNSQDIQPIGKAKKMYSNDEEHQPSKFYYPGQNKRRKVDVQNTLF